MTRFDPDSCIPDLFERQAAATPQAAALRCGEASLDYAALDAAANRLAHRLIAAGVGAGQAVALLLPRGIDVGIALLGIQKTGAFYVPIDVDTPVERVDFMLRDCGATALVTHAAFAARLGAAPPCVVTLDTERETLAALPASRPARTLVPGDLIYAIYTSGSTGQPKGALNYQYSEVNLCDWYVSDFDFGPQTRILIISSVAFDQQQKTLLAPLLVGGTVVFLDSPVFDAGLILDTVEREGITDLNCTPSAFYALLENGDPASWRQLASLRHVFLGGESIRTSRLRAWSSNPRCRAEVVNTYGPTECADTQTFHRLSTADLASDAPVPIGIAVPGCALYVLDEALQPVADGAQGQLWLGGRCVGGGYLNLPERSADSFRPDPFDPPVPNPGRMYATGDLVTRRADGALLYHGRVDHQVKIRGHRVELDEIEVTLGAHPAVLEAAVTAPEDGDGERRLAAWLRLKPDAAIDVGALRAWLSARLPDAMQPSTWTLLERFAYTASGKIDRRALTAPAAALPTVEAQLGHRLVDWIVDDWRARLHRSEVPADARFFELGGSSLDAIRFVARLSRTLGERVPMVRFFAAPTAAGLAEELTRQHAAAVARVFDAAETVAAPAFAPSATRNAGSGGDEDIAIVGMACRVPGAEDIETFWQNLLAGVDGIRTLDDAALDGAGIDAATRDAPGYVRAAGWIEHADCFDHAFFGIAPSEAALIDPQQRLLLETAWAALEHAGLPPDRMNRRVGVFTGVAPNGYYAANVSTHPEHRRYTMDYASLGNEKDYSATRIAFKLDLRGPALAVQTACSSSGVALHLAAQSLRAGECDAAIVGGAALPWPFRAGYTHEPDGPLSADGRTRSFDAAASGMMLTAGVACLVLKRRADALADGDTIHALVKASALNNDGAGKAGYTAPSVAAQAAVIGEALARADVDPASIGYVEAHGTGTALGDPIEVAALTRAYRDAGDTRTSACALGSVKSNVGHLDAAAAAAGAIKTVLALREGRIPASLHFHAPNPECALETSPFFVPTATSGWPAGGGPRRAALSSFGFGGTNFHAVLEAAPPAPPPSVGRRPWQIVQLSAKTPAALDAQRTQLAARLERGDLALADVAFTLDTGRARFAERAVVVASDATEAARQLRDADKVLRGSVAGAAPTLVFMFPGQGAQHVGMGAALYCDEPVYRAAVDRCAAILEPLLGVDLRTLLYPQDAHSEAAARLRDTQLAQPAIFTISYATAQLWRSLGLEAETMIGHSVGEFVAATLAGVFTLEDALAILAGRARLMQSMPAGGMLAVRLSEEKVQPWLDADVALAAVNAPELVVLSGPHAALQGVSEKLAAAGIGTQTLHTSHAFHSSMMDAVMAPFTALVAAHPRQPPQRSFQSSLTGLPVTAGQAMDPAYWAGQLRGTVRFAPGLADLATTLGRSHTPVFLEVGPGQNLSTSARQTVKGAAVIASLPHAGDASADAAEHFAHAIGRLWLAGIDCDPARRWAGETRSKLGLPTYPFARVRHWIEPLRTVAADSAGSAAAAAEHEDTTTAAAITPAERALEHARRVFAEVSGIDIATADDHRSFLELGFDSLLLTQVVGRLKSEFKIALRFRQLLEDFPNLAALAAHLAEHGSGTPGVTATAAAQTAVTPPDALGTDAAPKKTFGAGTRISTSRSEGFTPRQQAAFDAISAKYLAKTGKSKAYAQAHRAHLADPRTVSGFRPLTKELIYPIVTPRSEGAYLWDLDDNRYIDLTNGFGCIFFGHRPPWLVEAIKAQADLGFEIGPQTPLAGECARMFSEFVKLPRVAFCNTGSEAVMAAMRLARTVTGRNLIVMHTGDYHGIMDEVIVRGTPSLRSLPAAPGIPPEAVANTLILDYGGEKTLQILREKADQIAAVIVEPVQSRRADYHPREYLHQVRELCTASGAAFVMDEVITGFRCAPGGAQEWFGVEADLATYGKVIGGGLPVGVIAGQNRFMDALDGGFWQYGDDSVPEVGVTYFAGTFVRHPLTMAAVRAVSRHLQANPQLQREVNDKTRQMVEIIETDLRKAGAPVHLANFSSLFKPEFTTEQKYGELFFVYLREFGLHIWDGRPCFLTTAHSEADVERVIEGFRYAVAQMQAGGFFDSAETAQPIFAADWHSPYAAPQPGARIGRDADGNPAWFVSDPQQPGRWMQISRGEEAETV